MWPWPLNVHWACRPAHSCGRRRAINRYAHDTNRSPNSLNIVRGRSNSLYKSLDEREPSVVASGEANWSTPYFDSLASPIQSRSRRSVLLALAVFGVHSTSKSTDMPQRHGCAWVSSKLRDINSPNLM